MKQKTDILQSLAILEKFTNGYAEFRAILLDCDKTPKREYIKLWDYIINREDNDEYKNTDADKVLAFRAVFGASARYNTKKINGRLLQLAIWIDKVIVVKRIKENGHEDKEHAKLYREKGELENMESWMQSTLEKTLPIDEATRHYMRAEIFHDQYFYGEGDKRNPQYQSLLQEYKKELNAYYFVRSFKATIEELTLFQSRDKKIPKEIRDDLEHQIRRLPKKLSLLVELQVLLIQLYLNPSKISYNAFKKGLISDVREIASDQKYLLISLFNSLTIFPFLSANITEEQLSIYEFGMRERIFLDDGTLSMRKFNNVVFLFKSLGRFDLITEFISSHSQLIKDRQQRENSVKLAKCMVDLNDGKNILEELKEVKTLDYTFTLAKYLLRIKCTYEIAKDKYDVHTELFDISNNCKRLVNKYYNLGDITLDAKQNYDNFTTIIIRMSNTRSSENSKLKIEVFYDSKQGNFVEIKWLLEKIAEL